MGNADGGVGSIDTLTTVTARTVDVNAEILGINNEVLLAGFGEDGDSSGGSVNTTLALGDGDTLDAMNAAFEF